jgi:peptide chain release factor 2
VTAFDYPEKRKKIAELEAESAKEVFWANPETAQKTLRELERVRSEIRSISELETEIDGFSELEELARNDNELKKELSAQIERAEEKISQIEFQMLFQGLYDSRSAILSIHSGTGGVDAQDWTEMLLGMYLRFAERKGWKTKIISETPGQEAGIKSVTVEISGSHAYGYLKTEAGIHRLVRLSPFNANNLRQTSFASVEVLPEIGKITEVEINPADLRIDTFRSGGAGGQHVNKTSSAVRATHIPTGLVATCQSERSQLQNKEKALKILEAKLLQLRLENEEKKKQQLKGDHKSVQWGSQIRSYILHPYKLVKDHRTKYESKNPEDVLSGNLEMFIEEFLKSQGGR